MVTVATDMLREIRKEFKGGGGQFNVRLLGIRCSNFQGDEERTDASQMNIEKFLESKPPAVQSPPPAQSDDPMRLLPDSHEEQRFRSPAAAGTNRYAKKTPPPSKSTKRTLTPASLPTVTPAGSSKPIPCVATAATSTRDAGGAAETVTTEDERVHCPICQNALFSVSDNDGLNRHVDACLNGSMVRRAAQEESVTADANAVATTATAADRQNGRAAGPASSSLSPSSKRQRWSDFFGPRS
jgi:hypothetical protein